MRRLILGAVIAGGAARRFGSDKAAALWNGRPLIEHVIAGLAAQTDAVVICGRIVDGFTCLADRPHPGIGPLGGICAALHHAAEHGFSGVLTSACDTPLVPANLADRLVGVRPATIAGQPLFGYWPATLAGTLDEFLDCPSNRAVNAWARSVDARILNAAGTLPNINTPADLDALHAANRRAA
jgi:molybdopterin-guanine dinucleotide biosynthesis protein A